MSEQKWRCEGPGCSVRSYPERAERDLDAHHITDRNEMPNGGYVPENGISLCKTPARDRVGVRRRPAGHDGGVMDEATKKGWITITVPFEETGGGRFDAHGIDYDHEGRLWLWVRRAARELRFRAVDIHEAIARAWPVGREPSDRAKRLAEIEAETTRLCEAWDEGCRAEVCHGDHEHQIECHANTLPEEHRRVATAAQTALDALTPVVWAMVDPTAEHEAAEAKARCARGEHRRAGETMPLACADCGVDFADLEDDQPFARWPLTDADRCDIPAGFTFDPYADALHWDEGPIVLFARAGDTTWIATHADEDVSRERWCCAVVAAEEEAAIRGDASALRRRDIWEREPVLVVECEPPAGEAMTAWRASAERLKGLRCVFLDEKNTNLDIASVGDEEGLRALAAAPREEAPASIPPPDAATLALRAAFNNVPPELAALYARQVELGDQIDTYEHAPVPSPPPEALVLAYREVGEQIRRAEREATAALGPPRIVVTSVEPLGRSEAPAFVDGPGHHGVETVTVLRYPESPRGKGTRDLRLLAKVKVRDLARALRIGPEEVHGLERGSCTTDDAGWMEITTTLCRLGAGTPASEIADPIGSGALDRALAREEEPDLLAEHLRAEADREEAARPGSDLLICGAMPPPEPDEADQTVGDEPGPYVEDAL